MGLNRNVRGRAEALPGEAVSATGSSTLVGLMLSIHWKNDIATT